MVGTFGIDGSRRLLATASIFSRGFSACPAPTAELIMCASIAPAIRSLVACEPPLYCTCCIGMPVCCMNTSLTRCAKLP